MGNLVAPFGRRVDEGTGRIIGIDEVLGGKGLNRRSAAFWSRWRYPQTRRPQPTLQNADD